MSRAMQDDDISLVVVCAKKIEQRLRSSFSATGTGLGELCMSVRDRRVKQSTKQRIR